MPAAFRDYYTTLGVARDASDDAIKKAFRKLARKHHPDVAKDKKSAEEKFKEINEAYEVLSDSTKRQKYDQLGEHWRDGAPSPPQYSGGAGPDVHFGGTGFSDFFEQHFGGAAHHGFPQAGRGPGRPRSRRGADVEGDILVTLDEAMHGTVRSISMQSTNPRTGETQTHTFQVRIPAGVTDGQRIRVPGQGQAGHNGGATGDLFLSVRHAAHPDFSARGSDIYHELDIATWDAVLGAEVKVPTLDGALTLRIPAGAANGQHMRVRGRGLPKGKTGERGDYYVVLTVQIPTKLTPQERTLWEQLRNTATPTITS